MELERILERARDVGRQVGLDGVEIEQVEVLRLERREVDPRCVRRNVRRPLSLTGSLALVPAAERRALRPVRRPSSGRAAAAVGGGACCANDTIALPSRARRLRWNTAERGRRFPLMSPPAAPCGYCLRSAAIAFANVPLCSAAEKAGLDANASKVGVARQSGEGRTHCARRLRSAAGLFASAAKAAGFALIAANAAGFAFIADIICAFSLPCAPSEAAAAAELNC